MKTKTKNIHKRKTFFFSKMKRHSQNLKGIHAITSEIIDATDGRATDDRRRTNFDFMSSADIVKQS